MSKSKSLTDAQARAIIIIQISKLCDYSGTKAIQLFLDILTDCNYHTLRKDLEQFLIDRGINK